MVVSGMLNKQIADQLGTAQLMLFNLS
ncbi:MAG: hypothetical protein ACJ71Q_16570 [Terriglobales bacterium]